MLAKKVLESIPRSIRVLRSITISVLDGGVTFHQTRVLFLIKEGFGQSQIAESFQISPAAVCRLMHQMEAKGLIAMKPGIDRRERTLELTKNGSKILASVSRQIEKKLNHGLAVLTPEEKESLAKGLTVLDKLIIEIKEG